MVLIILCFYRNKAAETHESAIDYLGLLRLKQQEHEMKMQQYAEDIDRLLIEAREWSEKVILIKDIKLFLK